MVLKRMLELDENENIYEDIGNFSCDKVSFYQKLDIDKISKFLYKKSRGFRKIWKLVIEIGQIIETRAYSAHSPVLVGLSQPR